ncbi:O-methyltransferas-like protein family 3 [Myriangium duriaei CBS 260.36]|uniref:O-methyltransferas-like protein family 3 n=1 Tax=Myriangium duriaei CBS 260.36 TaxID=1168546 RepID=A0A9P4IXA4_9PEZI|nr:O-methyltransferas-like protein family 3 [Myriangium duriaei CBS 260.36]
MPNLSGANFVHEKDDRWAAVDEFAWSALYPSPTPQLEYLDAAIKHQHSSGLPDIAVSPLQGSFLQLQVNLLGSKRILEVGTLGGYSTIWFAGARENVKVTTIDIETKHTQIARESVTKAGFAERVEFITAPGVEALTKLRDEVQAGKREQYDFVFIDADKLGNKEYVELSLGMVKKGACIIVDNVVRRGRVASAEIAKEDDSVKGSRDVIEAVGKDKRLQATVVQTVGEKSYDGMLICRVL